MLCYFGTLRALIIIIIIINYIVIIRKKLIDNVIELILHKDTQTREVDHQLCPGEQLCNPRESAKQNGRDQHAFRCRTPAFRARSAPDRDAERHQSEHASERRQASQHYM